MIDKLIINKVYKIANKHINKRFNHSNFNITNYIINYLIFNSNLLSKDKLIYFNSKIT